jgi:hypothetical protein
VVPDLKLLPNPESMKRERRGAVIRELGEARRPPSLRHDDTVSTYVERARKYAREVLGLVEEELKRKGEAFDLKAREAARDIGWFVQVQLLGFSPADVARGVVDRKIVDGAIRRVSLRLEIPLRPLPRRGRPPGVHERSTRRVTRKEVGK